MTWVFDSTINPTDYFGFVYEITNNVTGQRYIGKKTLWSNRRGKATVASDWQTYWGSSTTLLEDIQKLGEHHFSRRIIHWCFTKSDCSYLEAKEQFDRNVLGAKLPDGTFAYYNRNILGKFFQAPGAKTEKPKLKEASKRVKIGVRLTKQIQKAVGTQKDIAEKFGVSVSQVAKIRKASKDV